MCQALPELPESLGSGATGEAQRLACKSDPERVLGQGYNGRDDDRCLLPRSGLWWLRAAGMEPLCGYWPVIFKPDAIEGPVPSSDRTSNNGRQPGLRQNEDGLADAATRTAYVGRQGSEQSS